MASASYKSAVARISSIRYTDLNELKRIRIPEKEQGTVDYLVKPPKKELKSPKIEEEDDYYDPPMRTPSRETTSPALIADQDTLLKMFENGTEFKCVRVPKREQRNVHLCFEKIKQEKN